MGVDRAARRAPRVLVVAASLALLTSSCSASTAAVSAPPQLAAIEVPTATAVPTATPVPTPTPTPEPTPTPLPTPTPVPTPSVPTEEIRSAIDDGFAALDQLGVSYSFALFTDELGYLDERSASVELIPASNQKVVTAVGALELLPPDFRFVTTVLLDDDQNVYVVGGGDPTLTRTHVRGFAEELIVALSPAGSADDTAPVTVNDVVVDPSYFSATRFGPGWPERYVPADVGPMSGLMIDNNQHRGDAAYLADPDQGNASFIAQLLAGEGIQVTGVARVGDPEPTAREVARRTSPSLISLVDTILGRSDNEVAEALVRQIALDQAGNSEIEDGKAAIHARVRELGVDLGAPDGDGSGLSRLNRLSARELVEVLRIARASSWWATVENGLADGGDDGTLADRLESDLPIGSVKAKTGTLADVASLSGVITTVDGAPVLFSFIINGEAIDDALEIMDGIVVAHASATLSQLDR